MQSRLGVPQFVGVAIALAIGLTALAGASLVAAQRGEPGEPPTPESFQGCVNNHTGVLRIVDAGQQCAEHETPIQLGGSAGDAALQERIDELEAENDALEARIVALENNPVQMPACLMTEAVDGQERDDIVFEGCNVHVRDGSGDTGGITNGQGNLIVGYNETSDGDTRTGSHNLIVGTDHSYTSSGGFVAGQDNTISGSYSSVSGGHLNQATGQVSSVSGGLANFAGSTYSSVSGGTGNSAIGLYSSVSGGYQNTASGDYSSVSGGYQNKADGGHSSVSGGQFNVASNWYASVSGGNGNTASGFHSSVSGGISNTASGDYSSISGGAGETVDGQYDWRAGDDFFTEE